MTAQTLSFLINPALAPEDNSIIQVPFSGFYYSSHDDAINEAVNSGFQDDHGEVPEESEDAIWEFTCKIDFDHVWEKYSEAYVKEMNSELKLSSLVFESLSSPREYNFATDRIFATISNADVDKMLAAVSIEQMTEAAKQMFTSRDGFSSSYSPQWREWGTIEEWDHNQLHCLLCTYIKSIDHDMEHLSVYFGYELESNGHISNWCYESAKANGWEEEETGSDEELIDSDITQLGYYPA